MAARGHTQCWMLIPFSFDYVAFRTQSGSSIYKFTLKCQSRPAVAIFIDLQLRCLSPTWRAFGTVSDGLSKTAEFVNLGASMCAWSNFVIPNLAIFRVQWTSDTPLLLCASIISGNSPCHTHSWENTISFWHPRDPGILVKLINWLAKKSLRETVDVVRSTQCTDSKWFALTRFHISWEDCIFFRSPRSRKFWRFLKNRWMASFLFCWGQGDSFLLKKKK